MTEAAKILLMARGCLDLLELSADVRMRSAAILARQALERALYDALEGEGVDARHMSFRTPASRCLQHLTELGDLARNAAYVWAALSPGSPTDHGYELPPTLEALLGWGRWPPRWSTAWAQAPTQVAS